MSLRIPIDHTKLIDSPYNGINNAIFEFTYSDTESLVQDVINGHRTCYLISGYRGAGKSSLIKKLEADIKVKDNNVLFIYLSFAKYELRSILLRKLIRNFYLQLADKKENKTLYSSLRDIPSLKEPLHKFYDLYDRTFYEVSQNSNEKKTSKVTSIFGYNANLKDLLLTGAAVLTLIASILGLDLMKWYSFIPLGASIGWNLFQFNSLEKKKEKEDIRSEEYSKNSFYDDEIAEYHLMEILTLFKDHMKPVFVLDELDKINNDELIENLMNELKPLMLSGLASFIVVAGQDLYYNYYSSHTKDDSPLSTLFSKVFHVSLLTASELRILFNKLLRVNISELTPNDVSLLEAYVNYLILQSKRIPRRFITLIRQNLLWENNQAFLEIETTLSKWEIYSKVLNRISLIDNQAIASNDYPPPIRDYFNMQLLIKAHRILNSQNAFFNEHQI